MKIHHSQFERHSWCAHAPWAHRDLSISHVTLPRLFEVSTAFRALFSFLWIIWSSGSSWWMFRYVLARRLTVHDGSETSSGRVIGRFSSSFSPHATEETVRISWIPALFVYYMLYSSFALISCINGVLCRSYQWTRVVRRWRERERLHSSSVLRMVSFCVWK